MNYQLTEALITLATNEGILDQISWENGISNLSHVERMISYGINVPQDIIDYLSSGQGLIFEELDGNYFPRPIFESISRVKFAVNKPSIEFLIKGSYFLPDTQVDSDILNITGVEFINSQELIVTVSTMGLPVAIGTISLNEIVIPLQVNTFQSSWIDLREGGTDLTDLDTAGGTDTTDNIVRDSDGIGINSTNGGWAKMLGLRDLAISREHSEGMRLVYKIQDSGSNMFGMMSSERTVDSTMYNNSAIGFYISSPSNFWGFYAFANTSNTAQIGDYDRLKIVFPTTLTVGSDWECYGLTTGQTWDEGVLIASGVVPNGTQPPGDTLYPCITPNNGPTARLQAFNTSGE